MDTITATELNEKLPSSSIILVDVRTPAEFEGIHIEGAKLHPLGELKPEDLARDANEKTICLVCHSGMRAREARDKLASAGIRNAMVLDGGMLSWKAAGLPAIIGRQTISLGRQVQLAAGFVAFAGMSLGFVHHDNWHWLSGMVGAGFIYSALTDTCPLGMVLTKMPWNRACGTQK
jgi:rhodanese-related sulfurtransferase